jgi:hypothetical protein
VAVIFKLMVDFLEKVASLFVIRGKRRSSATESPSIRHALLVISHLAGSEERNALQERQYAALCSFLIKFQFDLK